MTKEELAKYIYKKVKRGYPPGELRNELLQNGYEAEDVDRIMNTPKHSWDSNTIKKNSLLVNLICLALFLLSGKAFSANLPTMIIIGIAALIVAQLIQKRSDKS